MDVPLLDLTEQYQAIADEIREAIMRVVASQRFILGPEVESFEQTFAERSGAVDAVGVASGSDALLISLMARDIGHGNEVLTTPFTFFATAGSISRLHAKIRFVDIDPVSFNIDPSAAADAVNENTRAIVPVHLFGQCADMDGILQLAEDKSLAVIEDACQAIDATWRERKAGTMGDFGCFSFFPSKNLGGFGDGGMITVRNAEDAERVRRLRNHGGGRDYHHDEVGLNSRLDALQAAVLHVKLRRLDQWTKARRANAQRYVQLFESAGLVGTITLPTEVEHATHVYNQFTIRVPKRDELKAHLNKHGVGHSVYYPVPLHLQPCFSKMGHKEGDFPHAEKACAEVVSLPVFPELSDQAQEHVVESIRSFYRP